MIGSLRGVLAEKDIEEILLDVGGVGYRIAIPLSTFEALGKKGEEATVLTHLHVREDELALYGFATARERSLFETLVGVSGIGPRLALQVLSRLTPERFVKAIRGKDLTTLKGIPGVGKKTAERMVLELKDKVDDWAEAVDAGPAVALDSEGEDAVKALIALGIRRTAAERAVSDVLSDEPDAAAAVLTRRALASIRE